LEPLAPERAPRHPLRILELFSGAGGLSLGWSLAIPGTEIVAAVDADSALAPLYEWNFPGTRLVPFTFGDSRAGDQSMRLLKTLGIGAGDIDVLLAGPPCQGFSAAGKRLDVPNNRLVFRVCDLAEILRPKVIVLENVPEFGRASQGRLLGRVRVQLASAGYVSAAAVLNATAYGVPQIRLRCFVVGVRKELIDGPLSLLPPPTHVNVISPRIQVADMIPEGLQVRLPIDTAVLGLPPTVGDAISDLPSLAAGKAIDNVPLSTPPLSGFQAAMRSGCEIIYNHAAVNHSAALIAALSQLKPGETPQSVENHPLRRKQYFRSAYARLDDGCVAPTMTTQTQNPGSGRFTHYRDDRVLSVREVARLQSFPDRYRFFGTDETQRRHIGNAVPPILSAAVARNVLRYLK
jgi:DNA (cytosine-5)-methyltransferase 1